MARPGKINESKLAKMLREGKSNKECAAYFKVTPAAISQKKRALKIKGSRAVASTKSAERAVTQSLNAVDQMQRINKDANEMLDLCMSAMNGDQTAIEKLSDKVVEKDGEQVGIVFKLKDPRHLALKAMAEIRKQLKLHLDIYEMLHDQQAVKDFQDVVIEVLSEYDPDARRKILDKLQERRAIRSVVGFRR